MTVGATFDEFVADLYSAEQNKECRYGLFDFVYEGGAGMEKNKLLFFMWSAIYFHVLSICRVMSTASYSLRLHFGLSENHLD